MAALPDIPALWLGGPEQPPAGFLRQPVRATLLESIAGLLQNTSAPEHEKHKPRLRNQQEMATVFDCHE
jgi:hypothetical protein